MNSIFQCRVPIEILLIIINDKCLSDIDIECLRLSCKAFYLTLPDRALSINPYGHFSSRAHLHPSANDHYEFLKRLQRPGNIHHSCLDKDDNNRSSSSNNNNYNKILCSKCRTFRPTHRYPIPSFRMEDGAVCETCMVSMLRMHMKANESHSYRGKEYFTCDRCERIVAGEGTHPHGCGQPRSYEKTRWLCIRCHMKICFDGVCGGWPDNCRPPLEEKKVLNEDPDATYCSRYGDVMEYECGCDSCMNGLKILLEEEAYPWASEAQNHEEVLDDIEGINRRKPYVPITKPLNIHQIYLKKLCTFKIRGPR